MTEKEFEWVCERCASVCRKLADNEKSRTVFYDRSQTDPGTPMRVEAQDLVFDYFARTAEQWEKAYETAAEEIRKLEFVPIEKEERK